MPTWLSDPPLAQYAVLFVFAAIAVGLWFSNRDRRSTVLACVAMLLLGLLFLCDRLFESPREEATRKVEELAAAATAADGDRFIKNVSDRVDVQGAGKQQIRNSKAWGLIKQYNARVAVWDFGHDNFQQISDSEIELRFMAKAESPDGKFVMRYVAARFVRDPDGQYRLKSAKFYNPAERGMNAEEPIPGFP